jgi:hypothetical protein
MTCACGCCGGSGDCTHGTSANLPGLDKIDFRLGQYEGFLATMLARLSSSDLPELAGLRTRDPADFTVAYLDACALVEDVLCFYQERIANEGYLGTATERRSLIELSRLVGYAPKPGVAASTYLSYTVEKGSAPALIPAGSKVNSIPDPGQDMVTFETSEPLLAREQWNAIKPRQTKPQSLASLVTKGLYVRGTASGLKAGDRLLFKFRPERKDWLVAKVLSVNAHDDKDFTLVKFAFTVGEITPILALTIGKDLSNLAHDHDPQSATITEIKANFDAATAETSQEVFSKSIELFRKKAPRSEGEIELSDALYSSSKTLFGDLSNRAIVPKAGRAKAFGLNTVAKILARPETMAPSSAQSLPRNSAAFFSKNASADQYPRDVFNAALCGLECIASDKSNLL